MKIQKTKAFTLVELIVVITILAILGTIAFISLQGYSKSARDSRRLADVNNIKTSLELFTLNTGKYPLPDNAENVTYSGGTVIVWKQGTVGDVVTTNLSRNLNKKPIDPLFETEYIYSTLENGSKYEVMSVYEGDLVSSNLLLDNTYADVSTVKIDGTYNGLYIKKGNYIVPSPSIITSEELPLDFNATTILSQVIDGGTNVPDIGTSNVNVSTGGLVFNAFEVYNGELNNNSSTGAFLSAYNVIANTYSGSSIENNGEIKILLSQTSDDDKINFTKTIILNKSSTVAINSTPTYSCIGTLPPSNVVISNDTELIEDTTRQITTSGDKCYYECTPGYSGTNCEITPFICGTSTVSVGLETYTTILVNGNCWTSQNMRHGTKLVNGSTVPSDTDIIEKWCYDNSDTNCTNEGGLYTWAEAMGFAASCNTTNCTQSEDTTKSVCGVLGTGWFLPTDAQWTTLTNAGATGWNGGNKLSGIVSSLPTLSGRRYTDAHFGVRTTNGYFWSSTEDEDNNVYSWYRNISSGGDTVYKNNYYKANGLSVVCIKN